LRNSGRGKHLFQASVKHAILSGWFTQQVWRMQTFWWSRL